MKKTTKKNTKKAVISKKKKAAPKRKTATQAKARTVAKRMTTALLSAPRVAKRASQKISKTFLSKIQKVVEREQQSLVFSNQPILSEDFSVSADDRFDEVDQANLDADQTMRMRQRNREVLYKKKLEQTRARLSNPDFGKCESCGEDIGLRRLEARPTATLCVGCKEEAEFSESRTDSGRMPKSTGEGMFRGFTV